MSKLPKQLTFNRGGQTLSGKVLRVNAEIMLDDGRRVFRNLTESDMAAGTEPAHVEMTTPSWTVNQKFDFMASLIRMVIDEVTCSLVITGSGGLGKTSAVLKALKEANLRDDQYTVLKGYTTPKGFYEFLYRNNGQLIIVDDCDSVFDTDTGINILKGALDSYDTRTICWASREMSRGEDDVPSSFEFTGRIIFISNLTQEDIPQPIRSRSLNIDLTMNTSERIERIEHLLPALASSEGVGIGMAREAFELLKENKSRVRDINIRTMVMTLRVRKTAGIDWKGLALFQLIHN